MQNIFNINTPEEKMELHIDDADYYFDTNEQIFEFSGKPNLIDSLERYFKSKLTSEDLKDNTPQANNLIFTTSRIQGMKQKSNETFSIITIPIKEINVSYLNSGIITKAFNTRIKHELNAKNTCVLFAAGWQYANQFIDYNNENKDAIYTIIDNLNKPQEELDKIIKKTGLLPSSKWTWKQWLMLFILVVAIVLIARHVLIKITM